MRDHSTRQSHNQDTEPGGTRRPAVPHSEPPDENPETPVATEPPRLGHAVRAFRYRDYRLFFTAAFLANLGGWLAGMARGYFVYTLTGSKLLLGTMAFCQTVPVLFLVPFTGVLVDRFHRKPILFSTQMWFFLSAVATAVLIGTGVVEPWHLLVLATMDGIASAVNSPAWQSITVELVGPEDLLNAIALNSMQFNMGRILGGLAGGVLYDLLGPTWCFGLNSVFVLIALTTLMQVNIRPPSPSTSRTNLYSNFVAGIRYLKRHRDLLAILGMAASVTIFALQYFTLLPVYAHDILKGTARTQSYLLTAIGVGALVAAYFQAVDRSEEGKGRLMLYSQAALAICIIVFALSKTMIVSLIALMGCGAGMVAFNTTANTTMQLLIPDRMRGRLMGVFLLGAFGLTPVGALLISWIAQRAGAPAALTFGALASGALTLYVALRYPHVKNI